ncbi:translocation/assembly module TamB domain-containing protein [Pectinatus haikarae]|uniref:translocation/assembly module TamB domain-containing protein n=1 Tax=Pectinatus haikarae TaxID=349096 RepID=UPI0018C61BEF|nr:translocation/assembly module TamB domain-containing protein [Pectinatus haikarae]
MKMPQKKVAIIVFAFIGILIAASFFYVSRSNAFMESAARAISDILTQTVHTKVEIGSLRVISLSSIRADKIIIYDKNGDRIISSDEAVVFFNPVSIIFGDMAGSITSVNINRPIADIIKREDGTWNYNDITTDSQTESTFKGNIKAENGEMNIGLEGKKFDFANVNADIDMSDFPQTFIKADFTNAGTKIVLSGSMENDKKHFSVKSDKIDVSSYLYLIPENMLPQNVTINGGIIKNADIVADLDGEELTALRGKADIEDASCRVMGMDVDGIKSQIIFNKDYLTVFAKAAVEGETVNLHGKVDFADDPKLALTVQSDAINPKHILKDIPFDGDTAFSAEVEGTVSSPIIYADLSVKEASLYGYTLSNARVKGSFADNVLYIKDSSFDFAGGKVMANGIYHINDESYKVYAVVENIQCDALKEYLPKLSGTISANAVFTGKTTDFDSIEGYASASLKNAAYNGIAIDKADVSLMKKGQHIDIGALTVSLDGRGNASAAGTIDGRQLNLEFYGSNIDLALLQNFTTMPATGSAAFYGHLSGNMDNPYLELELGAADGQILNQPYHNLRVSAVGSMDGVQIKKFTVRNKDNEIVHSAQGVVGFKGSRGIDLLINTKNARIENFAAILFPGQPITGNIDNTLHLTGSLDNIAASGHILFHEGSYHGLLLTAAEGDYTYSNGNATLRNFSVKSPFANVKISGQIYNSNTLDFDVLIDDIELAKMPSYLPYPIEGRANFTGHIGGTFDNINFSGNLQAEKLIFNGESVTSVNGQCNYQNGVLAVNNLQWLQGDGSVSLHGQADIFNGALMGKLEVNGVKAETLAAMANLKNDYLRGTFNGSVDLSGNLDNPDMHLSGGIENGYLKEYPLQKITIDASYNNNMITVNKFYGEQNGGKAAAKGTWVINGPIDMTFSTEGLDAKLLTGLVNYNADVTGTMNAYAQLSGTADDPEANVSFEIINGGVGTATFDKMTGLINMDKGVINVRQILLNKGEYRASASGKIPLAALKAKPWEMLTNYEQVDLNISLDNADLNIIPLLTKHVDWATGPLKGNLKINGTLAHPLFSGALKMDNGAMKIKELGLPIQNMQMDIIFDREKMKINNFSGQMGSGTYSLTGDTLITGGGLRQYNFSLNADKLSIDSSFYRGPFSAQISLSEGQFFDRVMPKLTGNIDIEKATVSFPGIPDSNSSFLPEMLIDMGINIGNDVRFYKSMLYDMDISGKAHFAGTTSHPMPSGEINVLRGSVEYLRTVFKIREGSAYFNQVGSFLPSITFKADANLSQTKVNLAIDGPVDNMQFLLTSEPQMSQEEIIKLLTFRNAYRQGENVNSSDLTQLATIGLQMSFFNEIENFVRDTLQLDEFNIVSDTVYNENEHSGQNNYDEVYNIEVGKYISSKTMLKYTNSINYDDHKFGIQYDINKSMSILNEWDSRDGYRMTLEANIKF